MVSADLFRGTVAQAAFVSQLAARTGVHCYDQLKPGREGFTAQRPVDDDISGFHRFPQNFKYVPVELWQFIKKQYPIMG